MSKPPQRPRAHAPARFVAARLVAACAISCAAYSAPFISSPAAALAEKLTPERARRAIRRVAGIELPESAVRIEKEGISTLGSEATVEATIKTAFRLRRDERGEWQVAEVRLGDKRWEDVRLLRAALDEEKGRRAQAELDSLRSALEAYRRERGHYPPVASGRELIDHLNPRYLSVVLRLDPWRQPYDYALVTDGVYRLRSAGADQKFDTPDDLTAANSSPAAGRE